MKILNKTNLKWWGDNRSETWAYKKDGDWWVVKADKNKDSAPRREKELKAEKQIDWRKAFVASLAGAVLGLGFFCLFLMYLLMKNAF